MSLGRYTALVLGAAVGSFALALPLLRSRLDERGVAAAAVGGGLAVANTLVAHFTVLWSATRSTKTFMGAVLGGMAGRMAVMLGAVVGGVLVFGLPKVPLAVSLLFYFVLFLALELSILHRHTLSEARPR